VRQELIAQTCQPLSVRIYGVLPSKGGALPLGNCGGCYLDEIGILKQLRMRGEDGCFRLFLVAMQLGPQGLKLPSRLG